MSVCVYVCLEFDYFENDGRGVGLQYSAWRTLQLVV